MGKYMGHGQLDRKRERLSLSLIYIYNIKREIYSLSNSLFNSLFNYIYLPLHRYYPLSGDLHGVTPNPPSSADPPCPPGSRPRTVQGNPDKEGDRAQDRTPAPGKLPPRGLVHGKGITIALAKSKRDTGGIPIYSPYALDSYFQTTWIASHG